MTGLLEQPQTEAPEAPPAETPEPAPAVAAERTCPSCGTGLQDGQDWCLECGSAQPGRLGARPGWRAALTVLAATMLLATGAVAAAYAALSSEATRTASAPPPPSATPTVAQPPSVPAPQAEAPTPTVKVPGGTSADAGASSGKPVKPVPTDDTDNDANVSGTAPGSVSGAGSTGSGDTGDTGSSGGTTGGDTSSEPEPLALKAGAASTYDPYNRGNGQTGDPDDVLDGKSTTAWQAPADANGDVKIGLAVSLEQARALEAVAFKADTPGFTVEVYGTRADRLPPDVLDGRWEHISDRKDVGIRERVPLDGKFKHVLLWITVQPADSKVAIPEVEVFG